MLHFNNTPSSTQNRLKLLQILSAQLINTTIESDNYTQQHVDLAADIEFAVLKLSDSINQHFTTTA